MADKVIDAVAAQAIHVNFCRRHKLVGWIVTQDLADYPGKFVARLITSTPSRYVLVSDTVTKLQASYRDAWCAQSASRQIRRRSSRSGFPVSAALGGR